MSDSPRGSKIFSLSNVADRLGRLGHELRNAVTVLYGISDELVRMAEDESVGSEARTALDSLENGISRTNATANGLFSVRAQLLRDEHFSPPTVAREVARWMPRVQPLATGLDGVPDTMGNARDFEALLMKLGHVAELTDGIRVVEHTRLPGGGVDPDLVRITFETGPGALPDELVVSIDTSVLAIGGRLARDAAQNRLVCEFQARWERKLPTNRGQQEAT